MTCPTLFIFVDLVRDADVEFVFEREDEIDPVERVDAELFERRGLADRPVDLLFLGDDPMTVCSKAGLVSPDGASGCGVSGIVIARER